ncbi:hypothetical protein BDQ12DRAFT_657074, partial [Crucibulum laeve]
MTVTPFPLQSQQPATSSVDEINIWKSRARETAVEMIMKSAHMADLSKLLWVHGLIKERKLVARALTKRMSQERQLAASFFFSKDSLHNKHVLLFPTLATQLSISIPDICPLINKVIEAEPNIMGRDIPAEKQLAELIVGPIQAIGDAFPTPMNIVIDGLDDCQGDSIRQRVACLIAAHKFHQLPLRIIITSHV